LHNEIEKAGDKPANLANGFYQEPLLSVFVGLFSNWALNEAREPLSVDLTGPSASFILLAVLMTIPFHAFSLSITYQTRNGVLPNF